MSDSQLKVFRNQVSSGHLKNNNFCYKEIDFFFFKFQTDANNGNIWWKPQDFIYDYKKS